MLWPSRWQGRSPCVGCSRQSMRSVVIQKSSPLLRPPSFSTEPGGEGTVRRLFLSLWLCVHIFESKLHCLSLQTKAATQAIRTPRSQRSAPGAGSPPNM